MKPINTTAEAHQDPLATLLRTGFPGGIERQEARGQQELVNSESLPSECDDKDALEAAGVVFGDPYADDKLFCPVTLPTGWKKQATDHSMHSNLVDDKGRVRARIFYKAAYYDRRADMHANRRYSISSYEEGGSENSFRVVAKDGNAIIHEFGETADYNERRKLEEQATAWLTERFPDWKSVAAYWD